MTLPSQNKLADRQTPFDLDALYDASGIAHWLQMAPRTVLELARLKKLPVVRFNARVFRFHPRSILLARGAKL